MGELLMNRRQQRKQMRKLEQLIRTTTERLHNQMGLSRQGRKVRVMLREVA